MTRLLSILLRSISALEFYTLVEARHKEVRDVQIDRKKKADELGEKLRDAELAEKKEAKELAVKLMDAELAEKKEAKELA